MSNRNKPLSAQAATAQLAVAVLAQHANWRKWAPARQIDFLFAARSAQEVVAQVGSGSVLGHLYTACVANRSVAELKHSRAFLLALAAKRTPLLERPDMAGAVGLLCTHYRYRLRELADWQPKRKNPHSQLDSLIHHLFDQYGDVPAWVIGAWSTAEAHRPNRVNLPELTIHLGRGQSLRTFPGLPVPLTKRLAHEMMQAPAACTFQEAYLYAQLAVRDALDWFGVVLESRLGREPLDRDEAFWLGVLDFFRAAPMVDPWQFGPVCDWMHYRRTVGSPTEPAQPGFSLRGRNMASVLAQTAQWHRGLAHLRRYTGAEMPLTTYWAGLPVPDFSGGDEGRVRITQLRSFALLVAEGQALHHCVASYIQSCLKGRCGIFSLTIDGVRALTLEVNQDRIVVQARGKQNRPMAADERFWVNRWLGEARLVLSKYV